MSSRTKKLLELHGELEAMGSIPLLPSDEYEEYATVCLDLLGVTEELARHPESDDSPAETVERMFEIAATLRKSGDDLTATEILLRAASLAEARDLGRMSSMAFNLAGITSITSVSTTRPSRHSSTLSSFSRTMSPARFGRRSSR